jgi:hypothetical protein
MRTIAAIFILALITVVGEIYSDADAVLTSQEPAPAAATDPAAAVSHAAHASKASPFKGG